jgi:hypothetical protein
MGAAFSGARTNRLLAPSATKSRPAYFGNPRKCIPMRSTKGEVAAKPGYEANGGGFNNAVGRSGPLS